MRPSLAASCALFLAGCEPMSPSPNPFQPVAVAPASSPSTSPPADERFADFDAPQEIRFEDLKAMAPAAAPAPAEAPAAPATAPTPAAPAPTEPAPAAVPLSNLAWAVRLVATVPEAQPPRAILGLPDGREVVVEPAALLPEQGLAVLSIGRHGVQLARFQARGDHALVESVVLQPQH